MPRVVWAEEAKTGLGYEIGPSQQKYQRKPILQSMTNPAVGDCSIIVSYLHQSDNV